MFEGIVMVTGWYGDALIRAVASQQQGHRLLLGLSMFSLCIRVFSGYTDIPPQT